MKADIHHHQLGPTAFVLLLSPALRLFPAAAARSAGKGAWLSALLAFLPAALFLFFCCRAAARRREGEGIAELLLRAAPGRPGRAALLALGLWLVCYAGFVLRAGADRMIVAVYPGTPAAFFVLTMAAAALAASFAPLRDAARSARLFYPVVAAVLALVLGAALTAVRKENLLPLARGSLGGVLRGSLGALDVLAWAIGAAALLLPELPKGESSFSRLLAPLALSCAALALISVGVVGSFGAELTAELSWPFFSLVRNLVFFRSVERVEALIVALWVFPDFLIVSLFLRGARRCLALSLGRRVPPLGKARLALPLCAASAAAFALFAAPDAQRFALLSQKIVPAANLFLSFVFFPALFALGRARGRL